MTSTLRISKPLVSVDWLAEHLEASNLVILHASLDSPAKEKNSTANKEIGIKNARFLDIKHVFSDISAPLPNTLLPPDKFQEQARILGIHNDTAIVVYDTIGVYSSPRVWWMFKAMGHSNIAVLNGGLPEWIRKGYETTTLGSDMVPIGNFEAVYHDGAFVDSTEVLQAISDTNTQILDARSSDRFMGLVDEPREGLRAGHIPTSKNIPYTQLQEEGKMISKERLAAFFEMPPAENGKAIFSCGSGITACILALGAEIAGVKNLTVYDGSWTDWGSNHELPIEK